MISSSEMQVHFIDVGQGDAIAIKLEDKNMLIDCGTKESSKKLVNYLKNNFFEDEEMVFDIFLITHPHQDHLGGGVEIFDNFQIKNFYRPKVYANDEDHTEFDITYPTQIFSKVIDKSKQEENCQTIFFDEFTDDITGINYSFDFLSPFVETTNINDFSPIILFTFMDKKIVFTGDAEKQSESKVILQNREELTNIDVLKVGHHGSTTSSTANFVELTKPKYAVISVGRNNEYKHPNKKIINRLDGVNSAVFRTDNNGSIVLGISSSQEMFFVYDYENRIPIRIEVWQLVVSLSMIGCIIIYFVKLKSPKNTIFQNLKQFQKNK